jgi:hypothetical protein
LYSAIAVITVICVIVGAALYMFAGGALPPHSHKYSEVLSGRDAGPDATTLISTLVVIYTFFAAAYGTLAPSLFEKKGAASKVALLFMLLAVVLDVGRVWNSTGDLYATTMRQLSTDKVYDAVNEFTRYLIANACVLILALGVAFWPAERWRTTWSRLTNKREATTSAENTPAGITKTGETLGQDGITPHGLEPRAADQ